MSSSLIVINIEGRPRKILQIQRRQNGDITIILYARQFLIKPGSPNIQDDQANLIRDCHVSIHFGSPIPENIIKFTMKTQGGELCKLSQYTKALKSTDRVALIMFHRAPSLRREMYSIKVNHKNTVDLGSYIPETHHLFYGIAAINKNYNARLPAWLDFNFKMITVGHINIIIFWSIAIIPSDESGIVRFAKTPSPEEIKNSGDLSVLYYNIYHGFLVDQFESEIVRMRHQEMESFARRPPIIV